MLVGPFPCLFDSRTKLVSVSTDALQRHTVLIWALALRGNTALHYAAWNGHGSIVELLLQHKADIEAKDNSGPGPWKAFGKRDEMLTGCVSWAACLDVLAKSSASSIEMVSQSGV